MKIGWYFNPISWHNSPPPQRGPEHAQTVADQLKRVADAGLQMPALNFTVREPLKDEPSYHWLREQLDALGMNVGLQVGWRPKGLLSNPPELGWTDEEWLATGADVDWLAQKLGVAPYLDDLGYEYWYAGHEVQGWLTREHRGNMVDAYRQAYPSMLVMQYHGLPVYGQRMDDLDRTLPLYADPVPWADLMMGGRREAQICSFTSGDLENPSRGRMWFEMCKGSLLAMADKSIWPHGETTLADDKPPQVATHFNVRTTDNLDHLFEHLEWFNKALGKQDMLFIRTLEGASGDNQTTPWDQLYNEVGHFRKHHSYRV